MERLAYGISEAAKALGVSRSTIYRAIWRGEIRVAKIGGRTVIPTAELERLLTGERHSTSARTDGNQR